MSIRQSGLKHAVYVECTTRITLDGITLEPGAKCELIHDLGYMYVLKTTDEREVVAPKDFFKDVSTPKN